MKTAWLRLGALILLSLGLASCGGGASRGLFEFTGDPERFSLTVLPESALGGELHGSFSVSRHDEADAVVIEIKARELVDLRAFYYELEYNPNSYSPLTTEGCAGFREQDREILELAVTDSPGRLSHGQIIANPELHEGLSGDFTLASIRFQRQAMDGVKAAALAPTDAASQVVPELDVQDGTLNWLYRNTGDYDQNGVVTISDLTPLGIHFGESSGSGGSFPETGVLSVIDGDNNGLITISDITPIGVGFDSSVSGGFNVYSSGSAVDYPADPLAANGATAELIGNMPLAQAVGDRTQLRLAFSFILPEPQLPAYYWLRPVDAAAAEGYSSTLVSPVDGSLPALSIPEPPASGEGTIASPFLVDPEQVVQFKLEDADGNDVTSDPLSSFSVQPETAAAFAAGSGTMTVASDASGPFNVSASYDGLGAPQVIRFSAASAGPQAVLTSSKQFGPVNLSVNLSGAQSTTPSGDIIEYAFDWEDDGVYDHVQSSSTVSHIFESPGLYTVRLRIRTSLDEEAEDSVQVEAYLPGGPAAVLAAAPLAGGVPLTVNYDASASSPANEDLIEHYEFDFNGDFDFSDASSTTGLAENTFMETGIYFSRVKVFGQSGLYSIAERKVTASPNQLPNADLRASKLSGFTPVSIEFDASHSSDSDGAIVQYEWDSDGDSDFDDGVPGEDHLTIDYLDAGGVFKVQVRVTDDWGQTDIAEQSVTITHNEPPLADLQADVETGFRPLRVNFDASGSSDADGVVVEYRWDFDYPGQGDPEFDLSGPDATPNYIYDLAGEYQVYLEVEDNGGKTDFAILSISVDANEDPQAVINSVEDAFEIGVSDPIEFDASGSTDPDPGDTIVEVAYDFLGSGSFGSPVGGIDTPVPFSGWNLPGVYMATVRVTDNHGATGYASKPITVTGGQAAPTVQLVASLTTGEAPLGVYFDADGADSNGVIEKYEFDFDGPLNGWDWQESGKLDKATASYPLPGSYEAFVRVTDDDGAVGLASASIEVRDDFELRVLDGEVSSAEWMDAAIVNGRPAVAYASGSSQLRFVIANDAEGLSWGSPQIINNDKCVRINLVELDGGRAGISYFDSSAGLKFLRAEDSNNDAWTSPVVVEASADNKDMRMVRLFNQHPAVAYFVGSNLKFKACLDIHGDLPESWPVAAQTLDNTAASPLDMAMIGTRAAIAYRNEFVIASDDDAASWSGPFTTGIAGGTYYSLGSTSGTKPRLVHDRTGFNLAGSDDSGMTWPLSEGIMAGTSAGKYISLAVGASRFDVVHALTVSANNFSVPIVRQLLLSSSLDLGGGTWQQPYGLDTLADQGSGTGLLLIGGSGLRGVAYRGSYNGKARILKWQVERGDN